MIGKFFGRLTTLIFTEPVVIAIALHILTWLVERTTNNLDDKILNEVKKALTQVK